MQPAPKPPTSTKKPIPDKVRDAFITACEKGRAIQAQSKTHLAAGDTLFTALDAVDSSLPATAVGLAGVQTIEQTLVKPANATVMADLAQDKSLLDQAINNKATPTQTAGMLAAKADVDAAIASGCDAGATETGSVLFKNDYIGYNDLKYSVATLSYECDGKQTKILAASLNKAIAFFKSLATALKDFDGDVTTYGNDVLVKHPQHFADVQNVLTLREGLTPLLAPIEKCLPNRKAQVDAADKPVTDNLIAFAKKLPDYSNALRDDVAKHGASEQQTLKALLEDPLGQHLTAVSLAAEEQSFLTTLNSTNATGASLVDLLGSSACPPSVTAAFTKRTEENAKWLALKDAATSMGVYIAQLQAAHAQSLNSWVSGEIRLYYFDSVPRLIQFLNPNGVQKCGDVSLQSTSDAKHAVLLTASQAVANLQEDVKNDKTVLAQAQTALDTAQTNLQKVQSKKQSLSNGQRASIAQLSQRSDAAAARLTQATADEKVTAGDLAAANQAATADPTNAAKAAAVQRAQAADDAAQRKVGQAQADATYAQSQLTDAQTAGSAELQDAQAAVTDATNKRGAAQAKVDSDGQQEIKANSDLRSAISSAYVAAVADNIAFARARDNSPFWVALPTNFDGSEIDPAKRVILYGSPDSRTLFVRGALADVNQVKRMVSDLDRPEAQAELNLYSLELDSAEDGEGIQFGRDAQRIVQVHLAIEQIEADAAQRAFRNAVSRVLHEKRDEIVDADLGGNHFKMILESLGLKASEFKFIDSSLVGSSLPVVRPPNSMAEALVDLAFLSPRNRLAVIASFRDLVRSEIPSLIASSPVLIPRSSDTGHVKTVLASLRNDEIIRFSDCYHTLGLDTWRPLGRPRDDHEFKAVLESAYHALSNPYRERSEPLPPIDAANLAAICYAHDTLSSDEKRKNYDLHSLDLFSNLSEMIGHDGKGSDIEAFRNEVCEQIRLRMIAKLNEDLLAKWFRLQAAMSDTQSNITDTQSIGQAGAQLSTTIIRYKDETDVIYDLYGSPKSDIDQDIDLLHKNFDKAVDRHDANARSLVQAAFANIRNSYAGPNLITPPGWYEEGHARLGQVDETLKRLMHAVDRDMKQNFLNPMIDRLGVDLQSARLQVGIFEKTMILASNRLVAQVDPEASGQLSGGSNQNPLADLAPFLQVFGSAVQGATSAVRQGAAGKLGAALFPQATAVSSVAGAAQGSVRGILNAANQTPKNYGGEAVYGLTSGNTFTVTPIFDPTGQALRFRLDYVLQTQTREPDGSVNPQLSRIERHSLNTEVQLSNFDVTQVSSFNVNSQVGLPPRKNGGIPILKDIYPLSEVPLIGWFSRREFQAGLIQQSLILTQTSMYPTMLDIMDLLAGGISYDPGQ